MRMLVGFEGRTTNNVYVVRGALKTDLLAIPVYSHSTERGRVVGWATMLRRDGDEVSLEVQLRPEHMLMVNLKLYELRADLDKPDFRKSWEDDNTWVLRDGNIRSLMLVRKAELKVNPDG